MRVLVLNGSPKCNNSITMQTINYIQKHFPEDKFEIIHLIRELKNYERDMSDIKLKMKQSDIIVFCYPVYKYQVPYYMCRFIELLKKADIDLGGKYAAQISTSAHFFDTTANQYIADNCKEMNMQLIHKLSADMNDLLTPAGRKNAIDYWSFVKFCVNNNVCSDTEECNFAFGKVSYKNNPSDIQTTEKSKVPKTLIITDCKEEDVSLTNMLNDFKIYYPYPVKEVNLEKLDIRGGCLGCMKCAERGECFYKDGFQQSMKETLFKADVVVYAFTIKDHALGSRYKLFEDRLFFNGHRPLFNGNTAGYILSGDYSKEPNLQMILEASNEMQHCFIAGVATDEKKADTKTDIMNLARRLTFALDNHMTVPETFYGKGGRLIFRDLVMQSRFQMKEDHKYYKEHKLYDYPKKEIVINFIKSIMLRMLSLKKGKKKPFQELMAVSYKEAVDKY